MTFSGNPLGHLMEKAYFCTVIIKQDAYEEVFGYFD